MNIVNYMKNNCWCDFKNNNRTLFYRSIYNYGIVKYKNPVIHNNVTETFTIYYPKNTKQIHAFNGNNPSIDSFSLEKINIQDLTFFIQKYYKLRDSIETISVNINLENIFLEIEKIKKIIELEAEIYSYEYLISNLANQKQNLLNKKMYQTFIKWKNDPNNKEPWTYHKCMEKIIEYYQLDISVSTFKQFIHFQEFIDVLEKKIDIHTIVNKIRKREKYGFLLLNFHNSSYQNRVIIYPTIVENIKEWIDSISSKEVENATLNLRGKATFPFTEVEGECVVIQNHDFDNIDIFGKIVICSVLTIQDTMKLLDSRAILVEYGGYLTHASIWSREYNKPCLVGCKGITKILHTGDTVLIDGIKECISIQKKTTT